MLATKRRELVVVMPIPRAHVEAEQNNSARAEEVCKVQCGASPAMPADILWIIGEASREKTHDLHVKSSLKVRGLSAYLEWPSVHGQFIDIPVKPASISPKQNI